MANPKIVSAAFEASAADLYWLPERNKARSDQSTGVLDLIPDLKGGWNISLGVLGAEDIHELGKVKGVDYVAKCVAERTQQYNLLKVSQTPDALIERKVFEELYLDKDGKIRAPKYMPNMGFRRGSVWFKVQVARVKDGLEVADRVPITLRKYASEVERIEDQVLENTKKLGRPTTMLDHLRTASELFVLGCNENKLRVLFAATGSGKSGSTTGQKCFKLCRLNKAFPNLKILDRLFMPVDNPEHIQYGPIGVPQLLEFMHRLDRVADKKTGVIPPELTEEDMAAYFSNVKANAPAPAPTMKPKAIESTAKQTDTDLVRDTMQAVLEGNTSKLEKHVPLVLGYNAITKIGATAVYPTVESVLVSALTAAQNAPNDPVGCIHAIQAECERLLKTIADANAQPVS